MQAGKGLLLSHPRYPQNHLTSQWYATARKYLKPFKIFDKNQKHIGASEIGHMLQNVIIVVFTRFHFAQTFACNNVDYCSSIRVQP